MPAAPAATAFAAALAALAAALAAADAFFAAAAFLAAAPTAFEPPPPLAPGGFGGTAGGGPLPKSGRSAAFAAAGGSPRSCARAARAFALAAIVKLPVLADCHCLFEKDAELPELLLNCTKSARSDSASCREVAHLRAQIADLADLVHLALVVNGLQVEQVVGNVRPVTNAAAGARPIQGRKAFQKNRMRLSHA